MFFRTVCLLLWAYRNLIFYITYKILYIKYYIPYIYIYKYIQYRCSSRTDDRSMSAPTGEGLWNCTTVRIPRVWVCVCARARVCVCVCVCVRVCLFECVFPPLLHPCTPGQPVSSWKLPPAAAKMNTGRCKAHLSRRRVLQFTMLHYRLIRLLTHVLQHSRSSEEWIVWAPQTFTV